MTGWSMPSWPGAARKTSPAGSPSIVTTGPTTSLLQPLGDLASAIAQLERLAEALLA